MALGRSTPWTWVPCHSSWNTRCLRAPDAAGAEYSGPRGPVSDRGGGQPSCCGPGGLGLRAARHSSGGLEFVQWAGLLVSQHLCA